MPSLKRAQTKIKRVLVLSNLMIGHEILDLNQIQSMVKASGFECHQRTLRRDLELLESLGMVQVYRSGVSWQFRRTTDNPTASSL